MNIPGLETRWTTLTTLEWTPRIKKKGHRERTINQTLKDERHVKQTMKQNARFTASYLYKNDCRIMARQIKTFDHGLKISPPNSNAMLAQRGLDFLESLWAPCWFSPLPCYIATEIDLRFCFKWPPKSKTGFERLCAFAKKKQRSLGLRLKDSTCVKQSTLRGSKAVCCWTVLWVRLNRRTWEPQRLEELKKGPTWSI